MKRLRRNGHSPINSRKEGPRITKKAEIPSCIREFFKNNKRFLFSGQNLFKNQSVFFPESFTYPNSDILIRAKRVTIWVYVTIWDATTVRLYSILVRLGGPIQTKRLYRRGQEGRTSPGPLDVNTLKCYQS